jgi:hypothetical protein
MQRHATESHASRNGCHDEWSLRRFTARHIVGNWLSAGASPGIVGRSVPGSLSFMVRSSIDTGSQTLKQAPPLGLGS